MAARFDRLLAPWVFLITDILFNMLSAVITHYFIGLTTMLSTSSSATSSASRC